jgi:DNA-binding transcriptional regulator GbsR (MarR family)
MTRLSVAGDEKTMASDAEERALLEEVTDAVGGLMEFWGFKRAMGRTWTLLYLKDDALSAADLSERLQLSAGAVSMTLAELERWGVVKRSKRMGERREYFEAETDIWKMISRVLRERELEQVNRALEVFARAHLALGKNVPAGEKNRVEMVRDRLSKLTDLARIGQGILKSIVEHGRIDLSPLLRLARGVAAVARRR